MEKKKVIRIISIMAVLLLAVIIGIICFRNTPSQRAQRQLQLAQRYLEDMDYEQAIAAYNLAIEIEPKTVEAYIGLADVYIAQGNTDMALEVLQQGYEITKSKKIKEIIDSIEAEIEENQYVSEEQNLDEEITPIESEEQIVEFSWDYRTINFDGVTVMEDGMDELAGKYGVSFEQDEYGNYVNGSSILSDGNWVVVGYMNGNVAGNWKYLQLCKRNEFENYSEFKCKVEYYSEPATMTVTSTTDNTLSTTRNELHIGIEVYDFELATEHGVQFPNKTSNMEEIESLLCIEEIKNAGVRTETVLEGYNFESNLGNCTLWIDCRGYDNFNHNYELAFNTDDGEVRLSYIYDDNGALGEILIEHRIYLQ